MQTPSVQASASLKMMSMKYNLLKRCGEGKAGEREVVGCAHYRPVQQERGVNVGVCMLVSLCSYPACM